jgi:hypothetical protein
LIKLEDVLVEALPVFTGAQDFSSGVENCGMLGNDSKGCCGPCGDSHTAMRNAWLAKEQPAGNYTDYKVWPTTAQNLAAYYAYGESQGQGPNSDEGVDLGLWLKWRLTHSIGPIPPLGGFAQIQVTTPQYPSALHVFGSLYDGENISQEAMNEYSADLPFKSTSTNWIGGHCTNVTVLPDLSNTKAVKGYGKLDTWGTLWPFTWQWWQVSREESYVLFTREQMNAPGGVFNGVAVAKLAELIKALHGTT